MVLVIVVVTVSVVGVVIVVVTVTVTVGWLVTVIRRGLSPAGLEPVSASQYGYWPAAIL
jgi:hypothetical protein